MPAKKHELIIYGKRDFYRWGIKLDQRPRKVRVVAKLPKGERVDESGTVFLTREEYDEERAHEDRGNWPLAMVDDLPEVQSRKQEIAELNKTRDQAMRDLALIEEERAAVAKERDKLQRAREGLEKELAEIKDAIAHGEKQARDMEGSA